MKATKEKGITLIALIITIIVILILVSVSIVVLINSNILGIAQDAKNKTKTAYEKEGNLDGLTVDNKEYGSLNDYIDNDILPKIEIKLSMISTNQEVTEDNPNVKQIKENVPIPKEFYYVGGTKNTGVVISDDASDENKGLNAELMGNQYVWVPVLQNQKLKIEIKSVEQITSIKIQDPLYNEITTDKNGNTIETTGTSYITEVNPTVNGIYTVEVTSGEETKIQNIKVTSLYAQDFSTKIEADSENAKVGINNRAKSLGITVEELLQSGDVYINAFYPGLTKMEDLSKVIANLCSVYTDNVNNIQSVNKYGGFYIARYEAGSDEIRTESTGITDKIVYSKKNKYPFSYVTHAEAITMAQEMAQNKNYVISELIDASAWDRTTNWLVETKAIKKDELLNSFNFANYKDTEFYFKGKYSVDAGKTFEEANELTKKIKYEESKKIYLLGTGVTEYTKRNNIYDLAGNAWEWTKEDVEKRGEIYKIYRGGVGDMDNSYYNITSRNYLNGIYGYENMTFRVTMYINI